MIGLAIGSMIPTEDPELAGAVDAGGLQQVVGNRQEELAEHEDAGRGDHRRHDDAGQGVVEAEVADHDERGGRITSVGSIVVARMQMKNALSHQVVLRERVPGAALTTTVSTVVTTPRWPVLRKYRAEVEPRPGGAVAREGPVLRDESQRIENSSLPGLKELSTNHSTGKPQSHDQQPQRPRTAGGREQRSSRRSLLLSNRIWMSAMAIRITISTIDAALA